MVATPKLKKVSAKELYEVIKLSYTVHFIRVRTRALPWRNDIHPFCGYAHALNLNLYVRAGI